jgi:hypothetical protein
VTFSAAMTWPSPSRKGAATDRMPAASCSSVSAQPRARTSRSAAARALYARLDGGHNGCVRGAFGLVDLGVTHY